MAEYGRSGTFSFLYFLRRGAVPADDVTADVEVELLSGVAEVGAESRITEEMVSICA